jgi:hypothetical protein
MVRLAPTDGRPRRPGAIKEIGQPRSSTTAGPARARPSPRLVETRTAWAEVFPSGVSAQRSSADVLDPVGQADPRVHAVLPHRDARRGELRVGERADRHRDVLWVRPVVDGRAAARAEEE